MISGAGMLDFLLTQSLEKLVLDHEACSMALRAVRGVEADPGDAASLIADVVAAPEFFSHEHTRRNWRRELSLPSNVIDRGGYADWVAAGAKTAFERATAEVERLLRQPEPPLDSDVAAALAEIMHREAAARGFAFAASSS